MDRRTKIMAVLGILALCGDAEKETLKSFLKGWKNGKKNKS